MLGCPPRLPTRVDVLSLPAQEKYQPLVVRAQFDLEVVVVAVQKEDLEYFVVVQLNWTHFGLVKETPRALRRPCDSGVEDYGREAPRITFERSISRRQILKFLFYVGVLSSVIVKSSHGILLTLYLTFIALLYSFHLREKVMGEWVSERLFHVVLI